MEVNKGKISWIEAGNKLRQKNMLSQMLSKWPSSDVEGRGTVNYTWNEYTENTSFHGVKYIFERRQSFVRRLLWFTCFVASLVLFIMQARSRVVAYLNHETVTDIKNHYPERLDAPAITFCNTNNFRLTATYEKKLVNFIAGIYLAGQHFNSNLSDDSALLEPSDALLAKLAHKKDDFLPRCLLEGKPCDDQDIRTFWNDFGMCYTFRGGQKVGRSSQLIFDLNLESYEHFTGPNSEVGAKVIIHDPEELPDVATEGLMLKSGQSVRISIEKTVINSMQPPHGDCDKAAAAKSNCRRKCLSREIEHLCGCKSPFLIDEQPSQEEREALCDFQRTFECARSANMTIDQILIDKVSSCECKPPCRIEKFAQQVSYGDLAISGVKQHENDLDDVIKSRIHALNVRLHVDASFNSELQGGFKEFKETINNTIKVEAKYFQYYNNSGNFTRDSFIADLTPVLDDIFRFVEISSQREAAVRSMKPVFTELDGLSAIWTAQLKSVIHCDNTSFNGTLETLSALEREIVDRNVSGALGNMIHRYNAILEVLLATSSPSGTRKYNKTFCSIHLPNFAAEWQTQLAKVLLATANLRQSGTCDYKELSIVQNLTEMQNAISLLKEKNCGLTDSIYLVNSKSFLKSKSHVHNRMKLYKDKHSKIFSEGQQMPNAVAILLTEINEAYRMWETDQMDLKEFAELFNPHNTDSFLKNKNWTTEIGNLSLLNGFVHMCERDIQDLHGFDDILAQIFGLAVDIYPFANINESSLIKYTSERNGLSKKIWDDCENEKLESELIHFWCLKMEIFRKTEECPNVAKNFLKIIEALTEDEGKIYQLINEYIGNARSKKSLISSNFLHVMIHFSTDMVTEITQKEAFDLVSLFSEIGGFAGLLLGASVLTLLELFDFCVRRLCLAAKRRSQVQSNCSEHDLRKKSEEMMNDVGLSRVSD